MPKEEVIYEAFSILRLPILADLKGEIINLENTLIITNKKIFLLAIPFSEYKNRKKITKKKFRKNNEIPKRAKEYIRKKSIDATIKEDPSNNYTYILSKTKITVHKPFLGMFGSYKIKIKTNEGKTYAYKIFRKDDFISLEQLLKIWEEYKKMKLIIFGPQGSGKGTQAELLEKKFKIPHISTGDLLRHVTGPLKKEVTAIINEGNLIPDQLMIAVLKERLQKKDTKKGFILDGFPRTKEQATLLDEIIEIDYAIHITLDDKQSIARITNRQTCKECGATFNKKTHPSKKKNVCDECGGTLYQRKDNTKDAVQKRLLIYHRETEPILKHYNKKMIHVEGDQSIEDIFKEIKDALKKKH